MSVFSNYLISHFEKRGVPYSIFKMNPLGNTYYIFFSALDGYRTDNSILDNNFTNKKKLFTKDNYDYKWFSKNKSWEKISKEEYFELCKKYL